MKTERIIFLALASLFIWGCGKSSPTTVNVGVFASLTGATATYGQSCENGVQMAVEEANAAGGFNGVPFKLFVEDDQSRAEEARLAVTRLLERAHVVAVIGAVTSSNATAAAAFCQKRGFPMVTPAATNPKVTEAGDYIFRVCFIDPFQGLVMARFAYQNLGLRKVAILEDRKSEYSAGLARFFRQTFEELGGAIVADEDYAAGDQNFAAQIKAIKAAAPEAIFAPGYYQEVGLIGRQVRDAGLATPLLGGDGWNSPRTVELAGTALEGCYFSDHFTTSDPRPKVHDFVTTYQKRFGAVPDAVAPLSYDAAGILLAAITRAESLDPARIRDALAGMADFDGVTGTITIDADRNARKSAVVMQVKGDLFVHVATIVPE